MTMQKDELARDIFLADNSNAAPGLMEQEWDENPTTYHYAHNIAEGLIAKGYTRHRLITTTDEIKDLPALAVAVHDDTANGGPLEAYVVPDDGTVMFKDRYPFHLMTFAGDYIPAERVPLPLTVIYEAGAA